jgi:hypothetical protein
MSANPQLADTPELVAWKPSEPAPLVSVADG